MPSPVPSALLWVVNEVEMATLTDAQIAGYAKGAGFPDNQIATAVAVALAESRGRTDATNRNSNGSIDRGVWQINSIHGDMPGDPFNPADNAKMAFTIWKQAGNSWRPWSTYKSGIYRSFLTRGNSAAGSPAIGGGGGGGTADLGASFPSLGNPFEPLLSGGLWARLGVFLLGGLLFLIGFIRISGIGSAAMKTAKGVVAVRTGGLVRL